MALALFFIPMCAIYMGDSIQKIETSSNTKPSCKVPCQLRFGGVSPPILTLQEAKKDELLEGRGGIDPCPGFGSLLPGSLHIIFCK